MVQKTRSIANIETTGGGWRGLVSGADQLNTSETMSFILFLTAVLMEYDAEVRFPRPERGLKASTGYNDR